MYVLSRNGHAAAVHGRGRETAFELVRASALVYHIWISTTRAATSSADSFHSALVRCCTLQYAWVDSLFEVNASGYIFAPCYGHVAGEVIVDLQIEVLWR